MPRLRHLLLLVLAAGALPGCDRDAAPKPADPVVRAAPAPAARPAAPASVAQPPEPAELAPDWRSRVPLIAAADVAATLDRADAALARGQLDQGRSPGPGALELYLAVLSVAPEDARAARGVQASIDALIERGRIALRAGRFRDAERVVRIAESLLPGHPDLAGYREHVEAARRAADWVAKATEAARKGRYTRPAGASALDYFLQARRAYPDFDPAVAERDRWNRRLLQLAERAAAADDFKTAEARLRESARLVPDSADVRVAELKVIERRTARTRALVEQGNRAVDRLQLERAEKLLAQLRSIAAQPWAARDLETRIHLARHYGPYEPGETFAEDLRAGGKAPEMVVIRYGGFMMGSDGDDPAGRPSEHPLHPVTFARGFAIGRSEVTVGDFRRFVKASGYQPRATRAMRFRGFRRRGECPHPDGLPFIHQCWIGRPARSHH